MSVPEFVKPVTLKSFDASTLILGTYQPMVGMPLEEPCFLIQFINNSATDVFISYDGVNDHDILPVDYDKVTYNFQGNAHGKIKTALLKKGTVIYVRGNPGIGFVYMNGFYQPQN